MTDFNFRRGELDVGEGRGQSEIRTLEITKKLVDGTRKSTSCEEKVGV